MAFKPLHDRVLVRRVQSDDIGSAEDFLAAVEKTLKFFNDGDLISGTVVKIVACGEGARKDSGELIAMAVKAGDRVLFGKWSGTEVTVDGEELLIMKESDILGILS